MSSRRTLHLRHWIAIVLCIINSRRILGAECGDFEWECENQECIKAEDRCDGKVDCKDGSDETTDTCIQIKTDCRKLNFICSYGACVPGTAKCNNIKDCFDGSDELPALCHKDEWKRQLQGNCESTEMQCKSGECIASEDKCDGQRDCRDGSDETLEVCSTQHCPPKSFRCGYGACVSGTAACNSIEDCADGSDEAYVMCNRTRGIYRPPTTLTSTIRTPSSSGSLQCEVPELGGTIAKNQIFGYVLKAGQMEPNGALIKYECSEGNILEGEKVNICSNGRWTAKWPRCFTCCKDTHPRSGYSTTVTFTLNGVDVSHLKCFKPKTIANFLCAEGFNLPKYFVETSTCSQNGVWTKYKQSCEMECGKPIPKQTQFSEGGIPINITEHPWFVGIYSEPNDSFICSGSLISPRRVVTAAHCFFGLNETVRQDKYSRGSPYSIGAGKKYREFNNVQDEFHVKRKVASVWIPHDYTGRPSLYHHDVAILTLVDFVPLLYYARPVCVSYPHLRDRDIPNGTQGLYTAFSRSTFKNRESTLQKIPGYALGFQESKQQISDKYEYDIPGDMFVMILFDITKACKGDSGSGFVVKNPYNDKYELKGVLSNSPQYTQDCALDNIVVMTNVLDIEEIVNERDRDLANEIYYESR